jgi:putative hydrolase of the HAD superfamily
MTIKQVRQLIFDADDTLWENNIFYIRAAEDLLHLLVQSGGDREVLKQEFQTLEKRVVMDKGYGSENYLYILRTLFDRYHKPSAEPFILKKFDDICRAFISHVRNAPQIFPQVPDILAKLRYKYRLYILTKGNIDEQWKKVKRSGLLPFFDKAYVEPEKNLSTYQRILEENKWQADQTCMIGNSPKSDINPALTAGCWAVYIPYDFTWVLDDEPLGEGQERLETVTTFAGLEPLFL